MRATLRNGGEVRLEGNELLVLPVCGEKQIGFRAVVLEVVHLAVQESVLEDRLMGWYGWVVSCRVAHPKERKVWSEL